MPKSNHIEKRATEFISRNENSFLNLRNIGLVNNALFNIFFIFPNKNRVDIKRLAGIQKSIDKKIHNLNNEFVDYYKSKLDYIDEVDFINVMESNEIKREEYEYVSKSFGSFSGLFFRLDRCFCLNDYLWIDEEIDLKERDKRNVEFQKKYNVVVNSILYSNKIILELLESYKEEYIKKKNKDNKKGE